VKWKNWAGNVTANPDQQLVVGSEAELIDVVSQARDNGKKIRAVGTGHSFTPICATSDTLVSLDDREECRVSEKSVASFWAGTKIGTAASTLWERGYSFENQGDIDVQSLSGALSTGTHGTGEVFGSFSAKTEGLRVVAADGVVHEINKERDPDLQRAAALSVGMLGLVSEASLQVSPRFYLREETQIVATDACLDELEALSAPYRNVEFYWLPNFDKCVLKTFEESSADEIVTSDEGVLPPPGTIERYLRPVRADRAYLVYRNIRTVPFLEMEYSVPIESGLACVGEIRQLMKSRFPEMTWVVEYRTQAQDDLMLSPAFGRPVATISVHDAPEGRLSEKYFRACEEIFIGYDGRPHWGKLCFLSPGQRADRFPGFESFSRVRQRFDPNGMFLNDFLRPLFI